VACYADVHRMPEEYLEAHTEPIVNFSLMSKAG